MSDGTYVVSFMALVVGLQLWRSLRILSTQTVHRFQSYDDVTQPFSARYREGLERLTSGRYVGRYEGASTGKYATRLGRKLFILAVISFIGWLMMFSDNRWHLREDGMVSIIGFGLCWGSFIASAFVDYCDQRNFKLRRLR